MNGKVGGSLFIHAPTFSFIYVLPTSQCGLEASRYAQIDQSLIRLLIHKFLCISLVCGHLLLLVISDGSSSNSLLPNMYYSH